MVKAGLDELTGKARIEAADVIAVRQAIYPDMVISADEAEALFAVNDAAHSTCPEWRALFVEALTDYLLKQDHPHDYLSAEKAQWLLDRIHKDGTIKTATELELLIHLIETANQVPPSLPALAMQQTAMLALSKEHQGGQGLTLTAEEVTRLRRVVYADAGPGGGAAVSRDEAAVLFALNDASRGQPNDPSWRDLFVHAVGSALLAASGYVFADADTAREREAWLEAPLPNFGAAMGKAFADAFLHPRRTFALLSQPDDPFPEANRKMDAAIAAAAPLTQEEAAWLTAQIGRDGTLDDNEAALLLFVADTASSVHPSLQPLIDQARARAAA